jgi:hypothetical protein
MGLLIHWNPTAGLVLALAKIYRSSFLYQLALYLTGTILAGYMQRKVRF